MSTFTKSIKVNGAVDIAVTKTTGTHTLYTAPSTGYALVQVSTPNTSGTLIEIKIGSAVHGTNISAKLGLYKGTGTDLFVYPPEFYVGPGKSLIVSVYGSIDFHVSGVEFTS